MILVLPIPTYLHVEPVILSTPHTHTTGLLSYSCKQAHTQQTH